MTRIEVNVQTGVSTVITLTPEEEAVAAATLAAYIASQSTPAAIRAATDDAEARMVKADAQVQAFLNMTPAQLDNWVDANIQSNGISTAFKVLGRIALASARGKFLR